MECDRNQTPHYKCHKDKDRCHLPNGGDCFKIKYPFQQSADPLTRTRKALSLALKTIEDLQGHKVTARDFQELMDNVNKIERG